MSVPFAYSYFSHNTLNLGDDMQTLACIERYGPPEYFVAREMPWFAAGEAPSRLIANGWFAHDPYSLLLPENLTPLYRSMHIARSDFLTSRVIAQLRRFEPIGARDLATAELLDRLGVRNFFSGCLTLTLRRPNVERTDAIVLCDLSPRFRRDIPSRIIDKAISVTQATHLGYSVGWAVPPARGVHDRALAATCRLSRFSSDLLFHLGRQVHRRLTSPVPVGIVERRLQAARELLRTYARAKLVVTSRLHCALPCLAIGTPVVFVHENPHDPRFKGYERYLRPGLDPKEIHWDAEAQDIAALQRTVEAALPGLPKDTPVLS